MAILKACADRDADQLVALHDKHRSWLVATNLPWLDATGDEDLFSLTELTYAAGVRFPRVCERAAPAGYSRRQSLASPKFP